MPNEITAACAAVLLSAAYKHELAKELKRRGMSRLGTTKWLMDTLFGWKEEGGVILDEHGRIVAIPPDIEDRLYGNDLSCCWNTDIKRFAGQMPKIGSKATLLYRLQCFDAALKIEGTPVIVPE